MHTDDEATIRAVVRNHGLRRLFEIALDEAQNLGKSEMTVKVAFDYAFAKVTL